MNRLIHTLNILSILDDMVDTNNHTLKGEFGKDVEEYCRRHSKTVDGKNEDFSRVPFDCSYEIAVDVVEKTIEYIKSELKKFGSDIGNDKVHIRNER